MCICALRHRLRFALFRVLVVSIAASFRHSALNKSFYHFIARNILRAYAIRSLNFISKKHHIYPVRLIHPEISVLTVPQLPDLICGKLHPFLHGINARIDISLIAVKQRNNHFHLLPDTVIIILTDVFLFLLENPFVDCFHIAHGKIYAKQHKCNHHNSNNRHLHFYTQVLHYLSPPSVFYYNTKKERDTIKLVIVYK